MIPHSYLLDWQLRAPWPEMVQIEQDLVLTRAIIEMYSNPLLAGVFAFRGGTAIQKLFYDSPIRYSEDLDLVQVQAAPAGPAIDAIRACLDPWLGNPKRDLKRGRVTLYYRFESETPPTRPMRLKVEINTEEHFTIFPLIRKELSIENGWFSGRATLVTYQHEELLGTKLRALYQRKKGRDLLDLAMALKHFPAINKQQIIECFNGYMHFQNTKVTRAQFEANLAEKLSSPFFLDDIAPLLANGAPAFDAHAAGTLVKDSLLALLPGDPWKGKDERAKGAH